MTPTSAARAFIIPVAFAALWQTASTLGWLNPILFPPPTAVFQTGWEMTLTGELPRHIGATLRRVFLGVFWGGLAGLIVGLLMGISTFVRHLLEPLVSAIYSTPKLTLFPLVMLFLGIGDASRVLLIALVAFIFVAVEAVDGIRSLDLHYVDLARNYGAGRWDLIRKVYFPGSLPHIFTGLRLAFSRSLVTGISVELISGPDGLGTIIWLAWETLRTERLYVGIIVAALLGAVAFRSARSIEKHLVPWRD